MSSDHASLIHAFLSHIINSNIDLGHFFWVSFDLLRYIDYSDSEKFVIWSFIYKTRIPVSPVTYHKFQHCLRSFFFLGVVRSIAIYWWFNLWFGIGPSFVFDAMEVPCSGHRTLMKSISYPFHLSWIIYCFIDLGDFFLSVVRSIATFKRFRPRICICLSSGFNGMKVPCSDAPLMGLRLYLYLKDFPHMKTNLTTIITTCQRQFRPLKCNTEKCFRCHQGKSYN